MKIAIQANFSRGKEIISLLESLEGINNLHLDGSGVTAVYYIDNNNIMRYGDAPKDYKLYTLEEFEKEFPFKIGDKVRDCSDNEVGVITNLIDINNRLYYNVDFIDSGQAFMSTNELKPYKEMKEERNITLTLDKAQEWYKKGGELKEIALQAFTEKELNSLPRSWEEYCRKHKSVCLSTRYADMPLKYDALIKLEQLRNCWRQDWKPTKYNTGYHIINYYNEYSVMDFNFISFLSFPTKEMALEFLECFRDLIEKAGDLI